MKLLRFVMFIFYRNDKMKVDFSFITPQQKQGLLLILSSVIVFGRVTIFLQNKVEKEGVYIKGTIVYSDGYKGGLMSKIRYSFKGHVFENLVHNEKKLRVGNQYFIKILSDDPNNLLLKENTPVPECLLDSNPPYEGWPRLPEFK